MKLNSLAISLFMVTAISGCQSSPNENEALDLSQERALDMWVSCDETISYPHMASNNSAAAQAVDINIDTSNGTSSSAENDVHDPSGHQGIIINGTAVDSDTRYPWAAHLYTYFYDGDVYLKRGNCGGTILNENWIMTAAHCVSMKEKERNREPDYAADFLYVEVGVGGLHKAELTRIKASKALCHVNYNSPEYLDNDVALVKLDTPLDLSADNVTAARLAAPNFDVLTHQNGTVIVKPIGWGKTEARVLSSDLLEVSLSIDPAKTKAVKFGSYPSAGATKNVCGGDSGGSVNHNAGLAKGSGTVVGIVSYTSTSDCNAATTTSAFARVSTYRNDIESVLAYCDQINCFE